MGVDKDKIAVKMPFYIKIPARILLAYIEATGKPQKNLD
jgi:hypothetical protein